MSSRGISFILGLLFLLVGGPATQTFAQSASPSLEVVKIEVKVTTVIAKFVCGTSTGGELAEGRYFTAINLANSNGGGAPSISLFMDLIPTNGWGGVREHIELAGLPGLSGLEIDCTVIASHFNADLGSQLIKGFVRLAGSRTPLNGLEAVAVYTATPAKQ